MAVAVYFHPKGMTLEQFDEIGRRLDAGGHVPPEGGLHLSCFGTDGDLMVYNVWESQEAFEKFNKILLPIVADVGVAGEMELMPIHRLDQGEVHIG